MNRMNVRPKKRTSVVANLQKVFDDGNLTIKRSKRLQDVFIVQHIQRSWDEVPA